MCVRVCVCVCELLPVSQWNNGRYAFVLMNFVGGPNEKKFGRSKNFVKKIWNGSTNKVE